MSFFVKIILIVVVTFSIIANVYGMFLVNRGYKKRLIPKGLFLMVEVLMSVMVLLSIVLVSNLIGRL